MTRSFPWRGYINQITYGSDLRQRVDDSVVARLADELIRQRYFTLPVNDYYRAAVAALESADSVTLSEDQDEAVTRDLLARLVRALDKRKPWPTAPFYTRDVSEWPALQDAPVIARIMLTERDVQHRLHRMFSEVPTQDGQERILVLLLQTGQTVALRASSPFREPGVDLLSHTEPASTAAAFCELTGIELEQQ